MPGAADGSAKTNDQSYRQHIRDRKDCGNYAALTVLPGDAGHLSYGRSQAALGSGTLFSLLDAYCERSDAKFAASLRPWLPRVQNKDCALDRDEAFRSILEKASTDPAMQAAQAKPAACRAISSTGEPGFNRSLNRCLQRSIAGILSRGSSDRITGASHCPSTSTGLPSPPESLCLAPLKSEN